MSWVGGGRMPVPAVVVAAALGGLATNFALPLFAERFIDDVLVAGDRGGVALLVVAMVATAGVRAGLVWCLRRRLRRVLLWRARRSARRLIAAVVGADPVALAATVGDAGDVASRVRRHGHAWRTLLGDVLVGLTELPAVPALVVLMVWFDPWLGGLALLLTLANLVAVGVVGRHRRRVGARVVRARGRLARRLVRDFDDLGAVRAGGLEDAVFSRWVWADRHRRAVTVAFGRFGERLAVVPGLVGGVSLALIVAVGAWLIIGGTLTVGALVACQTVFFTINDILRRAVEAMVQLADLSADLAHAGAVFSVPSAPCGGRRPLAPLLMGSRGHPLVGGCRGVKPPDLGGEAPKTAAVVLARALVLPSGAGPLSLDLAPGTLSALVGPSGSGKSVLCRVLAGELAPRAGALSLSGPDRGGGHPVAVVGRTVARLSGTVRDVVTLWDDDAPDRAVWRVLELAAVADVIARLPGQLDARLGAEGRALSGGQAQRLAIARALFRQPWLLCLDEALEALDGPLARRLLAALRADGVTALIVTHRADILQSCDRVVALPSSVEPGT